MPIAVGIKERHVQQRIQRDTLAAMTASTNES
jgi:hypothetical protein